MSYEDHEREMLRRELQEWLDEQKTDRKVVARRQLNRKILPQEAMAMRAAWDMVLSAEISLITKIEPSAFGRGHIVTYVAERLK